MSDNAYNTFATAVQAEMQNLDYEQQLGILTIVVSAMNQQKKRKLAISKKEKIRLFNELSGCIKGVKSIDAKKEYLAYLDERYGV